MNVSRGDVALARFPHASGGRGKKRPVVVVQAEAYNQRLRHAIVAEVTTNLISDPANLTIDVSTDDGRATGLAQDSAVTCLHLATMGEERFSKVIGRLSTEMMAKLDGCLKAALALS